MPRTNKKGVSAVVGYVLLIVISISVAGSVYFWLSDYGEISSCGDDFCDAKELANPGLCPGDCEVEVSVDSDYEDSPFAIYGPYQIDEVNIENVFITENLINLGAKSVRIIAPELENVSAYLINSNIEFYVGLNIGEISEAKTIVPKYKDKVKYWRLGNEPDGPLSIYSKNPELYVQHIKKIYEIVKNESPDSIITIGGLADGLKTSESTQGYTFLKAVLEEGGGEYFDVFAFHFQGEELEYINLKNTVEIYKNLLAEYGYSKPFWITEFGTYDGNPVSPFPGIISDPPYQSEIQQASGMFKRFVYGLSLDIEKMFWSLIIERHNFGKLGDKQDGSHFDNIGLVHNPCNDDDYSNPSCDGYSHKKLAYYTYKQMTEKLEGSDWDNIEIIQESDGVYIYKFVNKETGEFTWVAWSDSGSGSVSLDLLGIDNAKVVEAVPDYDNGLEVVGVAFEDMFRETFVSGSVELGEVPVFIEEETENNGIVPGFGVHPSALNNYSFAKDLGLNINREGLYFFWDWIDKNRNGNFKFKDATIPSKGDKPGMGGSKNFDSYRVEIASAEEIEIISNVCPSAGSSGEDSELNSIENEKTYSEFVEKLVERYDGDSDYGCDLSAPDCYNIGDNEYPAKDLIVTLNKNPHKFYQVCNSVFGACYSTSCRDAGNIDYAKKFAKVQELTYKAVKAVCSDCQVIIGGDSGKEEYPPVFKELNGKYVDIIDFHIFGLYNDYRGIKSSFNYLKEELRLAGFDVSQLKFWITEMGTYSGEPLPLERGIPLGAPDVPKKEIDLYQSETEQASGLIKYYSTAFGEDIEKVLWAWGIQEGFGCDCCLFDYTGLIYDGNIEPQTCDSDDPYDLGPKVKKLSYYSFKLLIEKLKSFESVEVIQDSNDIFVYKFVNNGKLTWVAWSDSGSGSVTLDLLGITNAKVTGTVPDYENGKLIEDGNIAFEDMFKESFVSGSVVLGDVPVFIEEND